MKRPPLRNIELAKALFGSRGGQARKKVSELLDLAMMNIFLAALDKHGERYATWILFQLIAQDADQPAVPEWLVPFLSKHREYLADGPDDEDFFTSAGSCHA